MSVRNKLSTTPCALGDNFGFDEEKIWTSSDCRAEFCVITQSTTNCPGFFSQISDRNSDSESHGAILNNILPR